MNGKYTNQVVKQFIGFLNDSYEAYTKSLKEGEVASAEGFKNFVVSDLESEIDQAV